MSLSCTSTGTSCSSQDIPVTVSGATHTANLFKGCTSLVGGNGTTYSSSHIDKEYARIDSAGAPGYLTRK